MPTPREAVRIRAARRDDAAAIATLLGQLGYPTKAREVRDRLERLTHVLVAECGHEIAGLAAYEFVELLHRPSAQCRITALVVDADHRRRGVASALVAQIEGSARRRGCYRLEVTTRPERDQARALYSALGFRERPLRLAKPLE